MSKWKGKVIPCQGAEDIKGAGTNGGKSSMRNQEAESESMRSRVEMYPCCQLSCLPCSN